MNLFTTITESLFAFVLMLGVLVTVHEFGHFIVAKWCGVRVLKFSIGFGPPIGFGRFRLAWTRGETEYVIAWFPLGGFVKMLGENPDEADAPEVAHDRARSLGAQTLPKKLAIVLAGPAMNLLLPVLVLMGFLWAGVQQPSAVLGNVEHASPAASAGLLPGDHILAAGGEPLAGFRALETAIRNAGEGRELALEVARGKEKLTLRVPVLRRRGVDVFGAAEERGFIGVHHARPLPRVVLTGEGTPAARAGLRSGDLLLMADGAALEAWDDFARAYVSARAAGAALRLQIERGADAEATQHEVLLPTRAAFYETGAVPAVAFVTGVGEDSPAARAGLAPGDFILAANGEILSGDFLRFQEIVRASGGEPLELQTLRAGAKTNITLTPERQVIEFDGIEDERYVIGVRVAGSARQGVLHRVQMRNPFTALPRAVAMTADITKLFFAGIGRMVSGEISRRQIGGPIEIARQSGRALAAGPERFLNLLILLSINLAILNLLPIPVLDGGQAALFLLEGVRGRELSQRSRELVQLTGFALVMLLMGFAFWNDFVRIAAWFGG